MKISLALLVMSLIPLTVMSEENPKHHTPDGFQNYPLIPPAPSLGPGFYLNRIWSSFFLPEVPANHNLSREKALNQFRELKDKNTLTWIGQSTFLIKIEGKTILTDPFFSDYAGPYSMGPKRFVKPGISRNNLPPIDVMLISHNHYDHLDEEFIEALPGKDTIHVFVPLGLKSFFTERGYIQVHELDWNESISISDFQITSLPTVHYSGRGLSDRNKTLWCSWALVTPYGKYFFAGDTAYSPTVFKQIGTKFGSFDLAMLTIGTYGNRKYGVNNPTTPEEAIDMGIEMSASTLVGMHWGTIEMSDEPTLEPAERFRQAGEKAGLSVEQVWLMKIGETRLLPVAAGREENFSDN